MTSFTKFLVTVWVAVGLPLWVIVSLWGGSLWIPLPIPLDEDFSYYVAWFFAVMLVFVPPVILLAQLAIRIVRDSNDRI